MSVDTRKARIFQFLASQFHEDWDLTGADWMAIADSFREATAPELVLQLVADLAWLAAQTHSPSRLFQEFGCYYMPQTDGLTESEWLRALSRRLAVGAKRSERGSDQAKD